MSDGERVRKIRLYAGWVILAFLLAWPPLHMALARRYHFSTWRYGGWGMYATPDGSDRDVYVFLSSCARGTAATAPWATGNGATGFFYLVRGARIDLISVPSLDSTQKRDLARRIKDIRSLTRPEDFRRLARWIDDHEELASAGALGIVVAEPHIDVGRGRVYADVFGAVRDGGLWSRIEPTTAEAVLPAMLARMRACP